MTSPLYPILEKRVGDGADQIISNQIDPWAFMQKRLRIQTFDGRMIAYEGVGFEGSPAHVFWSRYIEPFLEDLVLKELAAAVSMAKERQVDARQVLPELEGLLGAACSRVFQRMAELDRRLRGRGDPASVQLRRVDGELASMRAFIDRHVQAELEMWRSPMANPASPAHVNAASPILRLISVLGAALGAVLLLGGIYLAFAGRLADTKFSLFGSDFSSTSVGVSMAFIGAVMVILTFRRVLRSVDHLASLPDRDGA